MHVAAMAVACLLLMAPQEDIGRRDIVARLMPDAVPALSRGLPLHGMSKTSAIGQLIAARANADEGRAIRIAFLLAALNVDYAKNRDLVIAPTDSSAAPR